MERNSLGPREMKRDYNGNENSQRTLSARRKRMIKSMHNV